MAGEKDDDDELELLRLRQRQNAIAREKLKNKPIESPSVPRQIANTVLGGLTDAAVGIVDMPAAAGSAGPWMEENAGPFGAAYSAVTEPLRELGPISELPGLKQAKEALGEWGVTPENAPLSDALRTGVDYGAAAFTPSRWASKIPDAAMGAGAALGSFFSEGNPMVEFASGTAGYLASLLRGKGGGSKQRVRDFIDEVADEPLDAEALQRRIDSGELGTTADLVGDPGLYNVQAGAAVDPKVARQLETLQDARQQQIITDVVDEFGDADPEAAVKAAEARMVEHLAQVENASKAPKIRARDNAAAEQAALTGQLEELGAQRVASGEGLTSARQAAEEAATQQQVATVPFEDAPRPAQASRQLDEAYDVSEKVFEETVVQPKWQEFLASGDVDVKPMWGAAKELLDGLPKGIREALESKYGKLIARMEFKDAGGVATPEEVQLIFKELGDELDAIDPEKFTTIPRTLKDVRDVMRETLEASNETFGIARAATREKYQRFRPENVGKARRTSQPELLADNMGFEGSKGAATIRNARQAQVPEVDDAIMQQMEAYAKANGVDATFLEKYGNVLDTMLPADRARFINLADATDTATDAGKAAAAAEKADRALNRTLAAQERQIARQSTSTERGLEQTLDKVDARQARRTAAANRTVAARYADNPQKELNRLLSDNGSVNELTTLYKTLDAKGAGESLKAAVRDKFRKIALENTAGDPAVAVKARKQFRDMREKLVDSGVLTSTEADNIATALERTRSQTLTKAGRREMLRKMDSEVKDVSAALLASGALNSLGAGTQLMVGGRLRRLFRRMLDNTGIPPDLKLLNEVVTDPQALADLLKSAKTPDDIVHALLTKAVGASQATELLTAEEDEE